MLGGSSSACTTDTAKEAELAFWITVKRLADLKLDGSNTYSRPESVSGLELDSQFWFRFQLVLTCLPLGGTVSISPFSLLYTVHFALLCYSCKLAAEARPTLATRACMRPLFMTNRTRSKNGSHSRKLWAYYTSWRPLKSGHLLSH